MSRLKVTRRTRITRRTAVKQLALGTAAAVAAPYMRGASAAGKLTLSIGRISGEGIPRPWSRWP
jgi:hypothetical protein